MATKEDLYSALRKADAAGDVEGAKRLAAYIQTMPAEPAQPATAAPAVEERSKARSFGEGAWRGAAGIGNTALLPVRGLLNALAPKENSLSTLVTGEQKRSGPLAPAANLLVDRVPQAMNWLDQENASNPISYGAGKLASEVALTYPIGGAVAAPVKAAGASLGAPSLVRLGNAIATGGMRTGAPVANTLGAKAADLGIRMAGGAITGGVTAGVVDPEQAGTGAMAGGALPAVLKGLGLAGNALGRTINGPAVPANVLATVQKALDAGYVLPPSQAKPTLFNRMLEGAAGKLTTAQNASARNQTTTNALARKAVGLADDAPITLDSLQAIRQQAGRAYEAVRGAGTVKADETFVKALDNISAASSGAERSFPGLAQNEIPSLIQKLKRPSFDSGDAVDAIKVLRDSAEAAYAKGDKAAGSAYRSASAALEGALERHMAATGQTEALQALREARQLIAKTYTVESALNKASGNVDAKVLAGKLKKGKPLSGELQQVAEFASSFPKAAQTVESMGSLPQTSPLDWTLAGGLTAATSNPLMMAGVMARPAARSLALSPVVQNRLASTPGSNALMLRAADPAQEALARVLPLLAADR